MKGSHLANFPFNDLIIITLVFAFMLIIMKGFTLFMEKMHELPEDQIIGNWQNQEQNMVIQFYSPAEGRYEAKLTLLTTNELRMIKEVVVIKGLKFSDGKYLGGKVFCRSRGEWLNCEARLENEVSLEITKCKGLFRRTHTWTRLGYAQVIH
jgi:uncharacterized protein (DUF2147 family)